MQLGILQLRIPNGPGCVCGVVVLDGADGARWVIVSELPVRVGLGINELSACIATVLRDRLALAPERTRWFAHCRARAGRAATLQAVHYVWDARTAHYHTPERRAATLEERAWIDWHTPLVVDTSQSARVSGR